MDSSFMFVTLTTIYPYKSYNSYSWWFFWKYRLVKKNKIQRKMSNSIREINKHVTRFMQYDGTRFKRKKKKKMNRAAIPRIYKSVLPSSRQYHFTDCIPNANQRNITFCDISHSKSFIWDELINLVALARKRETMEKRERSTAFYARCCGESWRNNFIKLRNWNCFERSPPRTAAASLISTLKISRDDDRAPVK